jgi:eukaryotic-like serine/threonine-protein kinase
MSASGESTERDPLDLLVEEFLGRHRKGEVMDVDAFAALHPAHGTELRELLPTLQALEQVKREKESTGGKRARVSLPAMQQLGDFKIVRELGRGGMGVVFEAVQESLGRKVALKVLPQASLLTGSQLQRFLREAQIAAQLHHSNIVPVFGSGESDGYHWYAMQHIAGQSLDRWRTLQAEQPPQGSGAWRSRARFVARVGVQAASALHYAHSQGTLHRDVKPGNLLLEDNEHLWVTDFGLAKALEAEGLTHSGDLLGTLQYMAPEQFTGHYDARSEVYALGVTLYELLVLRPAFAAKTRSELMERIRTQRPESLRRLRPDVPGDLAIVIERAMARDPADRYHDAHELEQDLQAFLEDRPIAARRQSAFGLVLRWCRHNRAMATLAASTLLAMVGAGILGWVAYVVSNDARAKAETGRIQIAQEKTRADANVRLLLARFGDLFDTLVGRDPMLAIDEDPDTGEQTVIARTVVDPKSVDLLQQMLDLLGEFTALNAENQALRFETARAYRRVGAIHARLGRPENLARAEKAYEQALLLLDDVTEKDVTREIAAVQVDFGQLQFRQGDRLGARQRFQRALNLLEGEHGREGRALQFELAQAHFLLARLADRTAESGPGRGPGPGGAGPGGLVPQGTGPGGNPRREVQKFLQTSKEHLQSAVAIVTRLLEEDADNREFLALKARCLLVDLPQGPLEGGGRRDRTRDAATGAQRQEGVAILRGLVEKNPQAEQLRLELCKALIEDRRRDGRPRGGRGEPPGPDRQGPPEQDLQAVREAKVHAEHLLADEPLSPEYKALRAEVGVLLARMLRDRSDQPGEPARAELLREATEELIAVVDVERGLVNADVPLDPRFLGRILDSRVLLASMHFTAGRKAEGVEQMRAVADLLEAQVAMQKPGMMPRPMLRLFAGQLESGRVARIEEMLRSAGEAELLARLRTLREQLPPPSDGPDRTDRPDRQGAPPEPRRGGK